VLEVQPVLFDAIIWEEIFALCISVIRTASIFDGDDIWNHAVLLILSNI
jgi:hypothetical protein